ncbi:MAG TPA: HPr-rel-A system PqqD family peptide chaperone [Allosphingosinicella sp.]|uniref:HPr-rel-A system PqqD family peptide chaperone n=1 Tax=Allosphingosinicella sp. TaxID=2823234 RepID=UPI002F283C71
MPGHEPRFRADPADAVRSAQLEALTILFHRPSGMTHVLAPPGPQILEILRAGEATLNELRDRMSERFELTGGDDALAVRLEELVTAGLVERL